MERVESRGGGRREGGRESKALGTEESEKGCIECGIEGGTAKNDSMEHFKRTCGHLLCTHVHVSARVHARTYFCAHVFVRVTARGAYSSWRVSMRRPTHPLLEPYCQQPLRGSLRPGCKHSTTRIPRSNLGCQRHRWRWHRHSRGGKPHRDLLSATSLNALGRRDG